MKGERYRKKLKSLRAAQKERRKRRRIVWNLLWYPFLIFVAIGVIKIAMIAPFILLGYIMDLIFVTVGFFCLIDLLFTKSSSWKEKLLAMVFIIIGAFSLRMSWNLTVDLARFTAFNDFESARVEVTDIRSARGFEEIETPDGTFNLSYIFNRTAVGDWVNIEYFEKSKVVFKAHN